jgi:N-acetylmuramoyl-L-alanine amidase
VCDQHTWTALVEASWKPGDRQLLLTSPNLRGDDVADLQTRLARLGFDCGRVDGIFGPRTSRALADFQSNCGVPADGVCGPDTIRVIDRVSGQTGSGPGVGAVRERERLRTGFESVANCRVVVGQFGGLSGVTRTLARELRLRGATVMPLDEPDAVAQALAANHFGAHVYIGFQSHTEPTAVAHYYQVPAFESVGGRTLAELIAHELQAVPGLVPAVSGMRLPVLRETRMPAVLVTIGPVRAATDATPQLAGGVLRALDLWILRTG